MFWVWFWEYKVSIAPGFPLNSNRHNLIPFLLTFPQIKTESLDNTNMKEIKGLDGRLAGLQHILQNVQTFCQSQADMSQGLQQNLTSVQNIGRDKSVLHDLCASHQKQLLMLTKNHSYLRFVVIYYSSVLSYFSLRIISDISQE